MNYLEGNNLLSDPDNSWFRTKSLEVKLPQSLVLANQAPLAHLNPLLSL